MTLPLDLAQRSAPTFGKGQVEQRGKLFEAAGLRIYRPKNLERAKYMSLSVSKWSAARLCLSISGAVLLAGCSASFQPGSVKPAQVPIGNIQGTVHGGQAPVTGAQIYLFAAGTGGYGTNATSLITSGASGVTCNPATGNSNPALNNACYVTTDNNGNFALGGEYTCTQGQEVYMVALGGNPGITGTVNNTSIVQMAALAQCPAAGNLAAQVPYLVINEVTTVAFAYSMSGFATNAFNVSSSATGATALANAFANAGNIVNLQWGQAPAVTNGNPNSINPQAKIYALANVLASCVNTAPISPIKPSLQCLNLFGYAVSGSTPATDEASAIFNIAHNQAQNVTQIFNLGTSTPVFVPTLSTAPADWTMPVIYTGLVSLPKTSETPPTYTSGPFNIAFDASGNAWIGDRAKGVVEVGPQGAATTYNNNGNGPFSMVKGVAVSPVDGTIWVSDYGANTVYVMNSAGSITTTINNTSLTGNATLSGPILTAFSGKSAGRSKTYEANETTTGVIVFDSSTYAFNDFATLNLNNVATPGWISVDQNGIAWLPSTNTNYTGQVAYTQKGNSGKGTYNSSQANGAPNSYSTVADSSGNVWLAQITGTAQLEKIPSGSSSPQATVYPGGGLNGPYKLALDGGNNIWVANSNANTVSGFSTTSNTFLATNGFSTSAQAGGGCVVAAPDPSGNLWAANSDGSVTQLLGLSTPTAAPFYGALAATNNTTPGNLGTKP